MTPKLTDLIDRGFSVGFSTRRLKADWVDKVVYVVVIWKDGWSGRGFFTDLDQAAHNAYNDYVDSLPVGW